MFRRTLTVLLGAGLLFAATADGAAQTARDAARRNLPRFASLRASEVNLRTGPGVRYPIDWVYVRRYLPIEIVAEFDAWRKIRDWRGTVGWVHKSMLSGRRTVMVVGGTQKLRRDSEPQAPEIARVEENVIGRLLRCAKIWCRIEFKGKRGWLRRDKLWGIGAGDK